MTLVLLDVSGWIFAAHFRHPNLTRSDRTPTGATFGFSQMLWRFLREPPVSYTHIAAVFDPPTPSWRSTISPSYKANRSTKPNQLRGQYAMLREAARAFNVAALEAPGYEADDVIATYARRGQAACLPVVVVSSDKDFMQLVNPPTVRLYNQYPRTDGVLPHWVDEAKVKAKFGVKPKHVIDAQALMGDDTDGFKGVPGIGPRIAGELVDQYGTLEAVIAEAKKGQGSFLRSTRIANLIADHSERAILAKRLATLDCAADIFTPLDDLRARPPEEDKIISFLTWIESRELRDRVMRELPGVTHIINEATGALA